MQKKLEYKKWRLFLPFCINGELLLFAEEMLLGTGMEKPCSASPGSSTRWQSFAKGIPDEEETEVKLLLVSPKHKTGDAGNCITDIKNQLEI